MPEIFWVMLGVPILFAVPLTVRRSKKWKGFGGLIKTLLVLIVVGVSLVALHDWFELSFKRHQLTSMGAEDRLNALKRVGWNLEQVGESLRQGVEKQFGPYVSLPTGLPAISFGVPAPAVVVPEQMTFADLRQRELPLIPTEIYTGTLGDLAERGWVQTSSNRQESTVTSSEVPTPTITTRLEVGTISSVRVITEGITSTLTPTQTVTVQIFKDGTILVSSKSITETVAGAGGWLHSVRRKAEAANVLDVAGQLSAKDSVRTELSRVMAEMRTTLEFSLGITNPVAIYGVWGTTEKAVNRLLVLPIDAGQVEVIQPPRGVDSPEGSEQLLAIARNYRTRFWTLVARQEVLAEMISVEKLKKDGPERQRLLEDVTKLESEVGAFVDKINMAIADGVVYKPVGLQWLNLTLFELGILKNNI